MSAVFYTNIEINGSYHFTVQHVRTKKVAFDLPEFSQCALKNVPEPGTSVPCTYVIIKYGRSG
jgi:hypothetical protein